MSLHMPTSTSMLCIPLLNLDIRNGFIHKLNIINAHDTAPITVRIVILLKKLLNKQKIICRESHSHIYYIILFTF